MASADLALLDEARLAEWLLGRASTPDADGGFGLFLIERLTRRWGLTREDDNTRVWFEFDFSAAVGRARAA